MRLKRAKEWGTTEDSSFQYCFRCVNRCCHHPKEEAGSLQNHEVLADEVLRRTTVEELDEPKLGSCISPFLAGVMLRLYPQNLHDLVVKEVAVDQEDDQEDEVAAEEVLHPHHEAVEVVVAVALLEAQVVLVQHPRHPRHLQLVAHMCR